jgi:hypothetical protein
MLTPLTNRDSLFPSLVTAAVADQEIRRGRSQLRALTDGLLFAFCLLVVVLLTALDLGLLGSVAAPVCILIGGCIAWVTWRRTEYPTEQPYRWIAQALIPLAFALRGMFLIASFSMEQAINLPTIGSDAGSYLYWGSRIAQSLPVFLNVSPGSLAGTLDIGFHSFLGFALWLSGNDLLAVHTLLVLAGTFSPFLLWQISKPLLGRQAVWPGFLLAVSPLAIYLASVDLVKDALLTFFFLLAFWSAQRILDRGLQSRWSMLSLIVGFLGARLIRFYVGLVLEIGLLLFPVLFLWRKRTGDGVRIPRSFSRVAVLAVLFATAEGALWVVGEPTVIQETFINFKWVLGEQHAFLGPAGRFDGVFGTTTYKGSDVLASIFGEDSLAQLRAEAERPYDATPSQKRYLLETMRKIYGPYLWTPPTRDHLFHFLIGDWSAVLDVPLWYWAFPFGICGAWLLATTGRWDGALIAGYVVTFMLLLVVFRVSHRQRGSTLMPLLLIAATFGWLNLSRSWKRAILFAQAAAVAFLAVFYWVVRILLTSP